jgi:hypothetical protein
MLTIRLGMCLLVVSLAAVAFAGPAAVRTGGRAGLGQAAAGEEVEG